YKRSEGWGRSKPPGGGHPKPPRALHPGGAFQSRQTLLRAAFLSRANGGLVRRELGPQGNPRKGSAEHSIVRPRAKSDSLPKVLPKMILVLTWPRSPPGLFAALDRAFVQ